MKRLLKLKIEDYYFNGFGISFYNGKKYYLPFCLKGEIVEAFKINRRKGFRMYVPVNIIEKSSFRINPICEYFSICGACNFMHIYYKHQLKIKKNILSSALRKYNINIGNNLIKIYKSKETAYRNSATFTIKSNIGYNKFIDKKNIISIEKCLVLNSAINDLLQFIQHNKNYYLEQFKSLKVRSINENDIFVSFELCSNISSQIFKAFKILKDNYNDKISIFYYHCNKQIINYYGKNWINFKLNGIQYYIHVESFLQKNMYIQKKIISYIARYFSKASFKTCLDLYSGCGILSLSLVNNAEKIVGIENNIYSVISAQKIKENNNLQNFSVYFDDVAMFLKNNDVKADVVILNPPRSGAYIETMKKIKNINPEYIIYLSCNPVSLAWNLSYIIDKYEIERITIFDMFPHTSHIETLVILRNKK